MKHVRTRRKIMEEEFFRGAPPPPNLSRARDEVAAFVGRQRSRGRNVVFITVSHISHLPSFSIFFSLPSLSFFPSSLEVRASRWRKTRFVSWTTSAAVGGARPPQSIRKNKSTLIIARRPRL